MLEAEGQLAQLRHAHAELEARRAEGAGQLEAAGWRAEALEQELSSTRHEAEEAHSSLKQLRLRWGADLAALQQADDGLAPTLTLTLTPTLTLTLTLTPTLTLTLTSTSRRASSRSSASSTRTWSCTATTTRA